MGEGGDIGGHSLPSPVPHSPASCTVVPVCLPAPTLNCITLVFRSIKKDPKPGLLASCAKTCYS